MYMCIPMLVASCHAFSRGCRDGHVDEPFLAKSSWSKVAQRCTVFQYKSDVFCKLHQGYFHIDTANVAIASNTHAPLNPSDQYPCMV